MKLKKTLNKAVDIIFRVFKDIEVEITLRGTNDRYVNMQSGAVEKREISQTLTALIQGDEINDDKLRSLELLIQKDRVTDMYLYDRIDIKGYGTFAIEKPIVDDIVVYLLTVVEMKGSG